MDQLLHDRVNVMRLISRLQRDVNERTWEKDSESPPWIQVSRAQTSAKYARKLLAKIQEHEGGIPHSPSTSSFPVVESCLDGIEAVLQKAYNELTPKRSVRKSLVSSLPKPELQSPALASFVSINAPRSDFSGKDAIPQPNSVQHAAPLGLDLLAADNEAPLPLPGPTPSFGSQDRDIRRPESDEKTQSDPSTSSFLTTSLQTQEELSAQLAQMATRLKLNAMNFTEALEKDKAVLEGAEVKLESNFTQMKTQRSRLGAYSSKGGGTTWLVFISIIVVAVTWVVMFLTIRLT